MTNSAKIIATLLLIVAISPDTFAQQAYAGPSTKQSFVKNAIALEADNDTKTSNAANPETEARFSTLFPKASQQQWSARADNYWVSFVNNGRKANASFTLKGKMNYTITDCTVEHLPASFTTTIKKEYATYSLFNAIEIKAHGSIVYQAILEDSKGFITLRYNSEGVEKIQQVTKL